MNPNPVLLALAAAATLAQPGVAHEFTIGQLTVGHPYVVATPRTAKTAAGYFSVSNAGPEPDTLTSIQSAPTGMLHETTTDANGVAKMSEVEQLVIAPGQTVTLRPRAMHVMFMGLEKPLLVGDKVPATLVFEKAGPVEITFNVQSRAASPDTSTGHDSTPTGGMSHEGMSHDTPGMSN